MILKLISLSLSIIYFQSELCFSLKILGVFPLSSRSHFVMTGHLMKELAARGHQVDVINMFPQEEIIPNYRDINVRDADTPVLVNNISYHNLRTWTTLSLRWFSQIIGYEPCKFLEHPAVQDILKNKKGAYDVIAIELFGHHCYIPFGQHLGAPIVGIITSKMVDWTVESMGSPMNPSYMPSYFASSSQRMTFWERLKNTLLVNYVTLQINYYIEDQLSMVEKTFGRKLKSMKELYNDVSIVLVNSHHSINDIRPFNHDIIEVGGLHVTDTEKPLVPDLQQWLDESTDGFVLFTFGSMVRVESFPTEIIKIFYEMMKRMAPVRFLWKIVDPSLLPLGLPKNVKIIRWIPQVAVLKHKNLKLFITHGGLMGTQEAIVYKIPMVGLSVFVDQHTNMQSYANKKIAIALSIDDLTPDILTNAVKTVINDPTYRNNMQKVSHLFLDRPMSAIDTAVYWVEYTARHPKVLKSPAMELTWWQYYLLDVYGFLLACLLIVLFIFQKILRLLWNMICSREIKKDHPISKKNK